MNDSDVIRLIYADVQEIKKKVSEHDERFDRVDARLDKVEARLDGMDARFDGMDARFDAMDARMNSIDARFNALEVQIGENRKELRKINLQLENEIVPGIKMIAEGHSDLARNLKAAQEISAEREHMEVKLLFLEGEMRRVKETVAQLA